MEKLKVISPFRLSSLLRLQKDPKIALQLFLNPNPGSAPEPFRYSLLCYDLIITKLGRAKMFNEMERVVEQMKHETRFVPKEIIFCNIITYYGRSRLPDRALRMFDQIPSFRCQRTIKSLNTLLNALLICGELEKLGEIFMGINQYGRPDACTYNIMINCACGSNDLDSAWNVFDEMQNEGIQPNVVTFGTLIHALCVNSRFFEAFRLKNDMVEAYNVKPNAFVYVSLIKGLCGINEVDSALDLKEEMVRHAVELDSAVYSTLISVLLKAGRKGEAFEMLEDMKRNGCMPTTVTYNTLISGFCKEKDFDSAFGILNEMEKKGCKPDVISFNIIIAGLCCEGKLDEANDLFEDMPRRKCATDVVTYRTLFDGFCDGLRFKEGAVLLDEMVFKGYSPRETSIHKFIDGCLQEGDMNLLSLVLSSLARGNLIDVFTWRKVISTLCEEDVLSNTCDFLDNLEMVQADT